MNDKAKDTSEHVRHLPSNLLRYQERNKTQLRIPIAICHLYAGYLLAISASKLILSTLSRNNIKLNLKGRLRCRYLLMRRKNFFFKDNIEKKLEEEKIICHLKV